MYNIEHFQNPNCDLFGIGATIQGVGGILQGAAMFTESALNYKSTQQTNESNERNVAATNATNAANVQATNESNERIHREDNQFNAQQADLAYQRSTASNNIADLVQAGFSPQQAKMLMAEKFSGVSPSPVSAASAIPMQAPQEQPFQAQAPQLHGLGDAANALSMAGSAVLSSYMDPNGGTIGAIIGSDAAKAFDDISTKFDPTDLKDWYSIKSAISSSEDPAVIAFRESAAYNKMQSSLMGRRFFQSYAKESFATSMDNSYREYQQNVQHYKDDIDLSLGRIRTSMETSSLDTQLVQDKLKTKYAQLELDNFDTIRQLTTNNLVSDLAFSNAEVDMYQNTDYISNYMQAQYASGVYDKFIELYASRRVKGSYDLFTSDPELQQVSYILDLFDQTGLGQTPYMAAALHLVESHALVNSESIQKYLQDQGVPASEYFKIMDPLQVQQGALQSSELRGAWGTDTNAGARAAQISAGVAGAAMNVGASLVGGMFRRYRPRTIRPRSTYTPRYSRQWYPDDVD